MSTRAWNNWSVQASTSWTHYTYRKRELGLIENLIALTALCRNGILRTNLMLEEISNTGSAKANAKSDTAQWKQGKNMWHMCAPLQRACFRSSITCTTTYQCMSSLFFGFEMVESMYKLEVLLNLTGFKWFATVFFFQCAGYLACSKNMTTENVWECITLVRRVHSLLHDRAA